MPEQPENRIDDNLLGKFLAGETDAAESERVRQWLTGKQSAAEDVDRQDFDRFEKIWETAGRLPKQAPVDTDAAWSKLRSKMGAGSSSAGDLPEGGITKPTPFTRVAGGLSGAERSDGSERPDADRSPDPIPVKPLPATRRIGKNPVWQIAAAAVLLIGMSWFVLRPLLQKPVAQLAVVATDRKVEAQLPDGTKVFLNQKSKLTYPETFAEGNREVTLTGEAFFDVTPDPAKPFLIRARNTTVQVLGTSFSVRAYDENVRVAVRTGKVKFSAKKVSITLEKDQQASYQVSADTIRKAARLDPNLLAFRTGKLDFNKEPLESVLRTLNEFYGAKITLRKGELKDCQVTVTFENEPLDYVLSILSDSHGLRVVERNGSRITLDGDGCQ